MEGLQFALASPRGGLDLIGLRRKQPGTTDTLSIAARVGDVAAIRSMLAEGALVDHPRDGGRTALEVAAASGQAAAVRALLAAGADPNALVSRRTPAGNGPGRPGRLSALSVFQCKSVLYGVFVWARRALKS